MKLREDFKNSSYDAGAADAMSGADPDWERYDNDPDYADGYDSAEQELYSPSSGRYEAKTVKITKKQLRRIIKEVVTTQDSRVSNIERLIYSGDYDLANASLQALAQEIPFLRGHNPAKAKEMESEYDRLDDLLQDERYSR